MALPAATHIGVLPDVLHAKGVGESMQQLGVASTVGGSRKHQRQELAQMQARTPTHCAQPTRALTTPSSGTSPVAGCSGSWLGVAATTSLCCSLL